jgi:L-ascorbate metabolism protein UlaG (beta-lactamase superfamily)
MKARLDSVGLLTAMLLTTGLAAQENRQPASSNNAPKVTYVANDGFLIEAAGKRVLIDALFGPVFKRYEAPSPEAVQAMTSGKEPFADLDLILITHPHADHFDPNRVMACLRGQPRCQLMAHAETVARLRRADGFADVERRVHEVNLDPGSVTRAVINGIAVDTLCLDHSYGQDRPSKNLAFRVILGSSRLFHAGDASLKQNTTYLNTYDFEANPVDLLFLAYFDRSPETQQFAARKIKPSRIVAMHVPPAELVEETNRIREVYPHAVVFKKSMEQRLLPIEVDFHKLSGDYLGQSPPGATPEVFGRGTVSTDQIEHSSPAFSPDGTEVFWTISRPPHVIMTMRREGCVWSAPTVAPFSGRYFDSGPAFSVDGRKIYFWSVRPRPGEKGTGETWFVEKGENGWREPQQLDVVSRYPEVQGAVTPTIARNGTLYFQGASGGVPGLYRAELVNGEYARPQLLPQSINQAGSLNWTPFIAPDESYLLFSSNRHDRRGGGDLYISRRSVDGSWTEPVSLGEPVNSGQQERFPMLSPDGRYLFFTRPTPGHDHDVYWVAAASIPALRGTNAPVPQGGK